MRKKQKLEQIGSKLNAPVTLKEGSLGTNYKDAKTEFERWYVDNSTKLDESLQVFKSLTTSLLRHGKIDVHHIEGRIKTKDSALTKFDENFRTELEGKNSIYRIQDEIKDLVGIRVICLYEDAVINASKVLKSAFKIVKERDRYVERDSSSNNFGYRAIHLTCQLNDDRAKFNEYKLHTDQQFEIQIRTIIQDAWSVLDHKLQYKGAAPPALARSINLLAAVFEDADKKFEAIRNQIQVEESKAAKDIQVFQDIEPLKVDSSEYLKGSTDQKPETPELTAFLLKALLESKIADDISISPLTIAGILEQLKIFKPDITLAYISHAITDYKQKVEVYASEKVLMLAPTTLLRHIMFAADQTVFEKMLFDFQRNNFKNWLAANPAPIA
jgi:putative GTP pyrophosphokinase